MMSGFYIFTDGTIKPATLDTEDYSLRQYFKGDNVAKYSLGDIVIVQNMNVSRQAENNGTVNLLVEYILRKYPVSLKPYGELFILFPNNQRAYQTPRGRLSYEDYLKWKFFVLDEARKQISLG